MHVARPLVDRLMEKVRVAPNGCWQWTASTDRKGYGRIRAEGNGPKIVAHRAAYELLVGPIPEGLTLDHLCGNCGCVNPAHLEPVTNRENILRGEGVAAKNARKTHCKRGHEFTPENTFSPNGTWRACRTCRREYMRDRQSRGRPLQLASTADGPNRKEV